MIEQIRIILARTPTSHKPSRAPRWWPGACLAMVVLLAGCGTLPGGPGTPVLPPPAEAARKPVRIGLALGGGAARGFAHVGVIAVLEEAGLKPQLVVGTSAGSLVAALYASGKTSAQLQQTALNMEEVAITDWMLPIFGRGMFRGDALARYVNDLVANRTDGKHGDSAGHRRHRPEQRPGRAVPARRYRHGGAGIECGAGGVPAGEDQRPRVCGWRPGLAGAGAFCAADGRRRVVAVDISSPPENNPAGDTLQILLQTFAIMGKSINQYELKDADVVVRPSLTGLKSADFSARQRAIDAGRAAMLAALPQLKAKLEAAALVVQK
jgi:NTE family protein